ncbi:MAG: hypothetical protein JXJ04_14175 [Spirochaetales bacterium]|nr:hypothetical protein [Spirochaetales bacterium]
METATLITQAKKIINRYQTDSGTKLYSKAREFLRVHAGEKSTFFEIIDMLKNQDMCESDKIKIIYDQVEAFIEYMESGLFQTITLQQKAKTEITLDFFDKAKVMLKDRKTHPAGVVVVIGIVLEESLKTWIEELGIKRDSKKDDLPGYAGILEKAKLILRQDVTDILHWNRLFTHALKGEWEEVNDRKRITIMYEGVLLFLRKYIIQ